MMASDLEMLELFPWEDPLGGPSQESIKNMGLGLRKEELSAMSLSHMEVL